MTFSMKCTRWFVKHEAILKWLVGDRINKLGYQFDSVYSSDRPQLCLVHSCLFTHRTKRLEVAGLVSEFPRLPRCDFNVVKLYNLKDDNSLLLPRVYASYYKATQLLLQIPVTSISLLLLHIKLMLQVFNFFLCYDAV